MTLRSRLIGYAAFLLLLSYVPVSVFSMGRFAGEQYKKLENGVIVYPDTRNPDAAKAVKVEILSPRIVHVTASAVDTFGTKKSLMRAGKLGPVPKWNVQENGNLLLLHTDSLTIHISLKSGNIGFYDEKGHSILQEKKGEGKTLKPVRVQGEKLYRLQDVFDSPGDEAFYGLGQHQNGRMNYKGKDVELAQHNIVAVVPFLYSSRQYGILWDNYSITHFGDPRDYKPLSSLNLYTDKGEKGGLTASYFSDQNTVVLRRKEDHIDYQYLSDLKKIPEEFNLAKGKAVWEGQISASEGGIHKFLLYQSGYTKVWVDGKLIVNRWRQGWNPWKVKFNLQMKPGEKHDFKMEWRPASGQAFLALRQLDPMGPPAAEQDLRLTSEVGKQIDYYFIKGNDADQVISGYRRLTGKAPIMPKWAMGYWQSRERYENSDQLLGTVKKYRQRDIPLDNIVLDWMYWPQSKWGSHKFDPKRFPHPQTMVDSVHAMNAHIMISVWPKFYTTTEHYKALNREGHIFRHNIEEGHKDWVGPGYLSSFYDPFSAEAREMYWHQIDKRLNSKGFDAWWLDATEPDMHSNLSIRERKLNMTPTAMGPGAQYFNAYSLENSRAVYNGARKAKPNKRVFILTRSTYAGQQRYAAATWSGDVAARWSNLREQISAGINMGLSGIPYWTTDIGGFAVQPRYVHATGEALTEWRELNTRWFQFGTFCPLMRSHGQDPKREIYNIAPRGTEVYQTLVHYDKLRYRLMPYIYTLAGKTYFDNYTIMRGLVMDFPQDKKARNIGDQFMFGPSIMVNPVYKFKARSRTVYLPQNTGWYDLQTGKYYRGGQTIEARAPLSEIPLYVKAGSIIPFGPSLQFYDQKPANPITLYIYTGRDGHFELYEDEQVNYNYEKGAHSTIPFNYDESAKTLTIGERKGSFTGMLKDRIFNIVWVSPKNPRGLDFHRQVDKSITYSGKQINIKIR